MLKMNTFAVAALFAVPGALASEFESLGDDNAVPIHPRFRSHLKCPYADRWIAKGPEAAARELGLDSNGRKLRNLQEVQGSCAYSSNFGPMCVQFVGVSWTEEDMSASCDAQSGNWRPYGCMNEVGGWCEKTIGEGKVEQTAMELSPMADCGGSEMACESFMGGTFVAAGECAGGAVDETTGEAPAMGGPPPGVMGGGPPPGVDMSGGAGAWPGAAAGGDGDGPTCLLAPGAIGAAHQAGFSKGYSASCPGTPAQESPYMWPLKWMADTETHNMAYGSDDVVFQSKGRTYYMLNRNWKRSDTTYQKGALRTIGQGPCEERDTEAAEEGFLNACLKNQTDGTVTTMIHREGLMYFIDWKEDADVQVGETDASKIEQCTMMNLAVVGNIRPDWFLDKRGDDTDVQYLGDQHVYYADGQLPKLVKQWRKKDFASQYFVMSMMGNPPNYLKNDPDAPVEDSMHWPLILNVPGEGFGDDMLQVYRNHALLEEDDEDLFKIIEAFEEYGGCVDRMAGGGGGDVGPPVIDEEEAIPSNLEVDPLSWVSNEITFSPIWVAPAREELTMGGPTVEAATPSSSKAVLEVSDRVTVESCYDASSSMVDLTVHYHDIEPMADGTLPWMALGFRPTAVCAMTPPEGGNTPIVLVTHDDAGEEPAAHKTELLPGAKGYSPDAFEAILSSRTPLAEVESYAEVSLLAPMLESTPVVARSSSAMASDDTVSLRFKQEVEGGAPEVMNLMYAIGLTSKLGSHGTRACFQVKDIPSCGGVVSNDAAVEAGAMAAEKVEDGAKSSASAATSAGALVFALTAAAMSGV